MTADLRGRNKNTVDPWIRRNRKNIVVKSVAIQGKAEMAYGGDDKRNFPTLTIINRGIDDCMGVIVTDPVDKQGPSLIHSVNYRMPFEILEEKTPEKRSAQSQSRSDPGKRLRLLDCNFYYDFGAVLDKITIYTLRVVITHCRLKKSTQIKLLEFFVLQVTARSAADLLEIHPNSAALFYKKIRQIISYNLELEAKEVFNGEIEIDESYFGGVRKGKRGRGSAGKTTVIGMLKRGVNLIFWLSRTPKNQLKN